MEIKLVKRYILYCRKISTCKRFNLDIIHKIKTNRKGLRFLFVCFPIKTNAVLQDYWYCVLKARLSFQFWLKITKFMKQEVIRMSRQKNTVTDSRLLTKLCLLWKYKGPWMFLSCWYWSNLWMELELNGKCHKQI